MAENNPTKELGLIRYDAMCRAIADAHRVDEVKDIHDKAKAVEVYARQADNEELEEKAKEIRLRAARRAGELLIDMQKAGERQKRGGDRKSKSQNGTLIPTLPSLGISKKQSSEWQALATVPKAEFEAAMREDVKPTIAVMVTPYKPPPKGPPLKKIDPKAMWLWGRLCDFERDAYFDIEPDSLFASMTDTMQDDVCRILPLLLGWLEELYGRQRRSDKRTAHK